MRSIALDAYVPVLDALACPALMVDADGRVLWANKPLKRHMPVPRAARVQDVFGSGPEAAFLSAALLANEVITLDVSTRDHTDAIHWWRVVSTAAVSREHPRVLTLEDATERRRLRESLRASEARLELAMAASELAMWDWNVERDEVYYNDQWRAVLGLAQEKLLERTELAERLVLPSDEPSVLQDFERHYYGDTSAFKREYRITSDAGVQHWVSARAKVVRRDEQGKALRVIGVVRDITQRRTVQQEAEEGQRRWERAVRGTSDGLYDWNLSTGHVWYAARFREILGYGADEFPDTFTAFQHALHEDDRQQVLENIRAHLEAGGALDVRCRLYTRTGSAVWCRLRGQAERDAAGRPCRLAGSISDISAQLTAEAELQRSQSFYGTVLNSLPLFIAYSDRDERVVFANRSFEEFFGFKQEHGTTLSVESVLGAKRYAAVAPLMRRALAGETFDVQARLQDVKGRRVDLDTTFLPHRDERGVIIGWFVVARDVTERRLLEAELRQSQKMEAVGRLTGGIAHDFNNLLSVIVGNMQLLARPLRESPRLLKHAETALRAAVRGGELTRRLLAFARQQVLEPRVLLANELIAGMHELLRRALTSDIEITQHLDAELWPMKVDASQLENAVLNLVINARDAMPQGGAISIRTYNHVATGEMGLPAGDYAVLEVSDTGTGMTPEVLKRAFEPFFTTKDVGKGSGLGLSMVYGFVKQSGGHVLLTSTLGVGTTAHLYFPRITTAPEAALSEGAGAAELQHGRETLLVVEDDPEVRATAIALLRSLGYQTLEAATGAEALMQFMKHPEIALVFSDVMLPGGMLGTHLVQKMQERRPDLKVLLTSGFSEHVVIQPGNSEATDLLPKPYKVEELARRVRAALDRHVGDARELA